MVKMRINKKKPVKTGRSVSVARAASLPEGKSATVRFADGTEAALFNLEGKFYAIENFCPHKGYPLADSKIDGSIAICPLHKWRFDVRDGHCSKKKGCSVETFPVSVEDGMIKIVV